MAMKSWELKLNQTEMNLWQRITEATNESWCSLYSCLSLTTPFTSAIVQWVDCQSISTQLVGSSPETWVQLIKENQNTWGKSWKQFDKSPFFITHVFLCFLETIASPMDSKCQHCYLFYSANVTTINSLIIIIFYIFKQLLILWE